MFLLAWVFVNAIVQCLRVPLSLLVVVVVVSVGVQQCVLLLVFFTY